MASAQDGLVLVESSAQQGIKQLHKNYCNEQNLIKINKIVTWPTGSTWSPELSLLSLLP